MNVPKLRQEIAQLERDVSGQDEVIVARQETLDEALGDDHAHPDKISQARKGVELAEQARRDAEQRLEALRAKLPDPEELDEARSEGERIAEEYAASCEAFDEAWSQFLKALSVARAAFDAADDQKARVDASVRAADRAFDATGERYIPKGRPSLLTPENQRLAGSFSAFLSRLTPTQRQAIADQAGDAGAGGIVEKFRSLVA